jgi:hypothetical protein
MNIAQKQEWSLQTASGLIGERNEKELKELKTEVKKYWKRINKPIPQYLQRLIIQL